MMALSILILCVAFVQTRLMIQSPMSLKKLFEGGEIQASYANFGYIPYGHQMVGRIYYDEAVNEGKLCEQVPVQEFHF
jgi:hypothetical protein